MALDDGDAEGLVVHRPDRLARELHVQEVALTHAWAAGEHVRVFEAAEGAEIVRDDPNDPQRRFLRQVMGAAAELERGLIKARLQGGRRRKAAQGGYIGGARLHRRYGYGLVDGDYVPVPEEQEVIGMIRDMRRQRQTWDGIASALNGRGVKPPSGAAWYAMTVRRIAHREG
jgi:DNA invertase Pin-like site-specific DNA recombinase